MDAIVFNTPEFLITIHRSGQVTAQVTMPDFCPCPDGFNPVDISKSSLGKLLWESCTDKFKEKL
jgi:hypothetical protein